MRLSFKYLLVLFAIFLMQISISAQQTRVVNLQLKWKHQFQFAGYYAAIEKGYYMDAGIHVHLIEASEGANPSDAVFEGKAEFGVCTSDIVLMRSLNKKPVILAAIFQHSPQILIASTKSGITNVHDLVGKRIAMEPNAADIVAYMTDEGVSLADCIIDQHSFDPNRLLNGEIDAISSYITDELFIIQNADFDYTIISPSMGGIDFYGDVLFTTEEIIKDNPDLVNSFREASLKGWTYAMNNPEEIVQLIYNHYTKRHSIEHLRFEAKQMENLIMPNVVEIGYANAGRWESIADTYKKLNMIDASFTTKGLLYADHQKKPTAIPWKLIAIFIVILLVVGSTAYFFYSISNKLQTEKRNRLLIEKDLNESEDKFREMADLLPQIIFETDKDGKISFANKQANKILGYAEDVEIINLNLIDLIVPEDQARAIENRRLRMSGKPADNNEYTIRRKDGSLLTVLIYSNPIYKEKIPIGLRGIIVDITERKLAEDLLYENNSTINLAMHAANMAWWQMDIQTGKVTFAKRKAEMLGYNPEKFEHYLDFMALVHPEDYDNTMQAMRDYLEGKCNLYKVEYRILTSSGDYKWFYDIGSIVKKDLKERPIKLSGLVIDITERKQIEEDLNSIKLKLELALQSSNMGVWQYDIVENKRSFDHQACFLLGIDPSKFRGTAEEFFLTIHPDDRQLVKDALKRTIEQNVTYQTEYRVIWPDRSVHFITARGELSINNEGKPLLITGIIWDITDSKKNEELLLKLKKAVDNAGEAIFLTDKEGIFTFVNQAFTNIYGYTAHETVGKVGPKILKSGAMEASEYMYFWETLLSGKEVQGELINKRKDSTLIYIEGSASPIYDEKKNIIGFLAIQRDISERKKIEFLLNEKNVELHKINASKDKFFSIIAHDLRSPFSSFLGLTKILTEELPNLPMTEIQKSLVVMESSASNLFILLENLLHWAKIEQGLIPFSPESIQLHKITDISIALMMEPAKKKGVGILNAIPIEIKVFADNNMLQTIMRNLISNALKFTPKGGEINISAKTYANQRVEISVSDTGIGMSKDLLENLFRIDVHTKRPGTDGELSSGLGLLLCKEFVEKHGEKIWVESEEGVGSTFYFSLSTNNKPEQKT